MSIAPVTLPENLAFLAPHNQFVLCRIEPKAGQPYKSNKVPVQPAPPYLEADQGNPTNWLTAVDAYALANRLNLAGGTRYGVGFALTPDLCIFCLDIDSGVGPDGQWFPAVTELVTSLPGLALEFSHSERGLHGWGRCVGAIPEHDTRYVDALRGLHLELYSRERFILLGRYAAGAMVPGDALPAPLSALFPERSDDDKLAMRAEWSDVPHSAWHGPTDDDVLIKIMRRATSKLATLYPQMGKATFKQLWEPDHAKLAQHYPSATGGYDESRADQALACHLAFWTGNNWSRMDALMKRSGLDRPKLRNRPDYMHRTISKACAWQKTFYNDGKGIEPGAPMPVSAVSTTGISLDDFRAYLPQKSYLFVPTRELWPAASVNSCLPLVDGKHKPSDWLDHARAVHQMTWAPGKDLIISDTLVDKGGWIPRAGVNCFNLYRPPAAMPGNAALAEPWLDLLRSVYPNEADHMIRYFAHRRQRPAEKINHGLVLGGKFGIGKDTILEPVKYAVGPWNFVEIAPSNITGEFNGFRKSVILRVSEARDMGDVNRYALYEATKTLLATPPDVLRCNEKNLREHEIFNVMGVVFTTNHKDGLYLPRDDRRHFVAWSEREPTDFQAGYWASLYQWYHAGGLGHVVAYLDAFDLAGFDPKATPPRTTAWAAMVDAGKSPQDSQMADLLDALGNPDATTIEQITIQALKSSPEFTRWVNDPRNSRGIPHRFEEAGYVPVPNPDARSDGRWKVAGRRTPIYARRELAERDRMTAAAALCRSVNASTSTR